jgi:hypothetical protein
VGTCATSAAPTISPIYASQGAEQTFLTSA